MRTRSIALAGATALLLTGCGGGDDRTGQEVLTDATEALREAGSVTVAGTATQDGQEAVLDLHLQEDGAVGTITLGGHEIQLLLTGDQAFMQSSADFWASFGVPAEAAAGFEGEWLMLPGDSVPDLGPLSVDSIADELAEPESGVEEEVREEELDGEDVLVVTTEDGSTMSVLAGDTSYPVRIDSKDEDSPGVMELSRFGETEDLTPPDDYIDLSQMAG